MFLSVTNVLMRINNSIGRTVETCIVSCRWLNSILSAPAVFNHILARSTNVKLHRNQHSGDYIRSWNFRCLLLFDMILGLIVMVTLLHGDLCQVISEVTLSWAESVVVHLNRLLNWLLGVPAGLKLNSPLNQFLGKFFHYHIYLWTGYLSLLQPALVYLIKGALLSGVFGFTYQLCLLQDIFSLLTLHIYCFYVYAARLYYFQVYALSSLWRLFRGRKWNVLRRRVDLASYDVDQLFVGTILFTVLLFLLPTTALYYFVFVSLRLLVVIVNGAVVKIVIFINNIPFYVLLLRLVHSRLTEGPVYYEVSSSSSIITKRSQVPYADLYKPYTEQLSQTRTSYSWRDFTKKVMVGELIYPWNGGEVK